MDKNGKLNIVVSGKSGPIYCLINNWIIEKYRTQDYRQYRIEITDAIITIVENETNEFKYEIDIQP